MARVMRRKYPQLSAGVEVHSGLAAGMVQIVRCALPSMRGDLPAATPEAAAITNHRFPW
jgi:hypothetical protein